MEFWKDECGQGAAEYILLFGGIIVIAIAALLILREYFNPNKSPFNSTEDLNITRTCVKGG